MKRDDLWSFALACYAQPGVEAACLELQTAGADVCLLLAGTWLECHRIACDEARLKQLMTVSDDWRTHVVAPLRGLRQNWRDQADRDSDLASLRGRIKQLELEAEQIQLRRLQSVAEHWPTGRGPADWLDQLCADLSGDPHASLKILRCAAAAQFTSGD